MAERAYSLLPGPIQRVLWELGWATLRPIQAEAINEVLEGQRDIIIAARTAAGKTEAALLPILSRMFEGPRPSIQAIYVGPLKALINDQFRRLEDLCQRAEIPVNRWHGDVDAGKKRCLLGKPSGVLLITPESIESLFVNRSTALPRLFKHLSYVVIDEMHALVGRERGTHLRSLLYRLGRHVDQDFRMVGLSATLGGDFSTYAHWMRPQDPERVCVISDAGEQKRILYKVHAYVSGPPSSKEREPDDADVHSPGIIEEMYEHLAGSKNLVFANNKQDVEWIADLLNSRCQQLGRPNEFLVHHGSLSRELREFAEREMHGRRPRTTVCSSTLELGIDIGNVTAVGQVDAPWSVSSLVQRLGRSGRGEGESQSMRVYLQEQTTDTKTPLEKRFYPSLLRTIAITELMLEKPPWVEPPTIDSLDFSTLTQQVLSVLAETGGVTVAELYDRLIANGAFRDVDQSFFVELLRSLGRHDLVEQMDGGDLILAPNGETVVNHYSFYSAFATPVEYQVVYGGRSIGNLPALYVPRPGDHFILGGRRWRAIEIDDERREIFVQPSRGRKPPRFVGAGGEIHPRVRETMRQVLLSSSMYPYLNETAAGLLEDARSTAKRVLLGTTPLVALSESNCLWFTWTGTRAQRTLCLIAQSVGLVAEDRDIAIEFGSGINEVLDRLGPVIPTDLDVVALASRIPAKRRRKYDDFVSEQLLTAALAYDALDVPEARRVLTKLFLDN